MTYDKHNVAADNDDGDNVHTEELVHVKADLYVAPGEDPEAPDSPPAFRRHNGHPVNFYGTAARLAAMSAVLSPK